jgi:hypothetical protein
MIRSIFMWFPINMYHHTLNSLYNSFVRSDLQHEHANKLKLTHKHRYMQKLAALIPLLGFMDGITWITQRNNKNLTIHIPRGSLVKHCKSVKDHVVPFEVWRSQRRKCIFVSTMYPHPARLQLERFPLFVLAAENRREQSKTLIQSSVQRTSNEQASEQEERERGSATWCGRPWHGEHEIVCLSCLSPCFLVVLT